MVLPPVGWKHCATLQGGTHSGGYALVHIQAAMPWYTSRRLCLVHIQAIMPGSHSGGYDWYILARSMTLWAISEFFAEINTTNIQFISMGGSIVDFAGLMKQYPADAIRLLLSVISNFFKGIVYYLVLSGLSLGLNMVVETDINYRDANRSGGVK